MADLAGLSDWLTDRLRTDAGLPIKRGPGRRRAIESETVDCGIERTIRIGTRKRARDSEILSTIEAGWLSG